MCPSCGGGPSKSMFGKGVSKVSNLTGRALEKTVQVSETVYKEVTPAAGTAVKKAADLTKRGLSKAKQETLKTAKSLKDEGK